MAASFKNSFVAFFVSILLSFASGVQGENPPASSIAFEGCSYDDAGTLVANPNTDTTLIGNTLRTYEILCGKTATDDFDANGDNLYGPVTINGSVEFGILCGLIDETPDILEYIGEGVNGHTIFAPTDAAFNKDSVLIAALTADDIARQEFLQLHILGDTYLTTSLPCDAIFYTLNLNKIVYTQEKSKTKCIEFASTDFQIGGGNVDGNLPEIGNPINVWDAGQFETTKTSGSFALRTTTASNEFSADAIGCNGVIQVVDNVLLPGGTNSGSKGGKSGKSEYGKGAYEKSAKRRELVDGNAGNLIEDNEATKNAANVRVMAYENRRRRLEALLEPNGNIEQLN